MRLLPSVFLVFLVTGAWPGVANAADEEEESSPCCGCCGCGCGCCCGGVEKRDDGRVDDDDDGAPDEEEEEEKGRGRLRSIGRAGEVELVASGVSISATRAAGMPGALDDDDTGVEALLCACTYHAMDQIPPAAARPCAHAPAPTQPMSGSRTNTSCA
jgi:hypothetical protein